MGRYSDLYKDLYKREPTDFPQPINDLLKVGETYRMKLLTEPRMVKGAYGRFMPIVEVDFKGKHYTLYIPWVDLHNRLALLEKECEERKIGPLKGKTIELKRIQKYRFRLDLIG
jgi:hypothetical protein